MDDKIKKSKFSETIEEDKDDNEKELDDEIKEYIVLNIFRLSKIPKVTYKSEFPKFEIPKSSTTKKIKKFDPIDWKDYFPNHKLIDEVIQSYNNYIENSNLLEWQLRSKYNLSSWSRPFRNIIRSTCSNEYELQIYYIRFQRTWI